MTKNLKNEIPKDLGIKVGSEKEVFWTGVKTNAEGIIKQASNEIMLQEEVVKMCDSQIQKEKDLNTNGAS